MAIHSVEHSADETHRLATRKALLKLVPLLCAIYFMSFIDRTNVSLAKGQLAADLGISAAAYGLGAGIFFLGYALLEVPSNLAAYRFGPRSWIARIAVTWGTLSAAMMFVKGEWSFYILRVLLGISEAGLFPALMYLVTLWFAPKDRSVAVGWIYTAPAVALMVGNPLGAALMELHGVGGLHGWQWMFLLEGLPTILVGVLLYLKLPERPRDARWLSRAEAEALEAHAVIDTHGHAELSSANWIAALKRPSTILIGLIYFLNQVAFVGLMFFTPAMIQQMHVKSPLVVGFLSSSVGIGFLLGRAYTSAHSPSREQRLRLPWRVDRGSGCQRLCVHLHEQSRHSNRALRDDGVFRRRRVAFLLGHRHEEATRHSGRSRSCVHQYDWSPGWIRWSLSIRLDGDGVWQKRFRLHRDRRRSRTRTRTGASARQSHSIRGARDPDRQVRKSSVRAREQDRTHASASHSPAGIKNTACGTTASRLPNSCLNRKEEQ